MGEHFTRSGEIFRLKSGGERVVMSETKEGTSSMTDNTIIDLPEIRLPRDLAWRVKFIEAVEEHGAPLLGMSALLTTTMPNMGKTIEAFIDADLRDNIKIMVGGAPVTQEFADDMGADGYGKDAMACVALAKQLMCVAP